MSETSVVDAIKFENLVGKTITVDFKTPAPRRRVQTSVIRLQPQAQNTEPMEGEPRYHYGWMKITETPPRLWQILTGGLVNRRMRFFYRYNFTLNRAEQVEYY